MAIPHKVNNMGFQGFSGHTLKSLRKYYSISPLFGLIGGAVGFGIFMGIRTLYKNPDVIVDHHHTHPWDDYRDKQYKLIGRKDVHSPAPDWIDHQNEGLFTNYASSEKE